MTDFCKITKKDLESFSCAFNRLNGDPNICGDAEEFFKEWENPEKESIISSRDAHPMFDDLNLVNQKCVWEGGVFFHLISFLFKGDIY